MNNKKKNNFKKICLYMSYISIKYINELKTKKKIKNKSLLF